MPKATTSMANIPVDAGMSSPFSYTGKVAPSCSPSGAYIAYVMGTRLCVRATRTMAMKRLAELGDKFTRAAMILKWDTSQISGDNSIEERLLIAGGEEVRIFIIGRSLVNGQKPQTTQDGTILTIGPIANALWLTGTIPTSLSNDDPEYVVRIIVFGRNGVTGAQVWSGDGVELDVPSPKFLRLAGVYTKGKETLFSLLCRDYNSDTLESYSLRKQPSATNRGRHEPTSEPLQTISFEGTVLDSKEVKYSRSGQFIAVLDSPAVGYSVHLYSSSINDPNKLIHSYYGPHYLKRPYDVNIIPATSIEWLSFPTTELLLVADQSQTVSVLSPVTFKPLTTLNHFKGYVYRDIPVWSESVSSPSGTLIYSLASLPYSPMSISAKGIKHMCVASSSGYVATVAASMPSTVWIWRIDPASEQFSDLISVISHSILIKDLSFREGPNQSSQLLITLAMCNFVGVWDSADQQHPRIIQFSDLASTNHFGAYWTTITQKKQDYDIYAYDGRSFVVFSCSTEDEKSDLIDSRDDTNVLQIVADVEQRDLADNMSDIEDTFLQER